MTVTDQRKKAALMQRFIRKRNENGWRIPPERMQEIHAGIELKVAERVSLGAPIPEDDRARVAEIVFDQVCSLVNNNGGQFPREILFVNGHVYDRMLLGAMLSLTEERALTRTRAVLAAVNATFAHLTAGLEALSAQLEEAAKQ